MSHYVFQSGSRVNIFFYTVVEFQQLILIIREICTKIPSKISRTDDVTIHCHFNTPVHHRTDIIPMTGFTGYGIRLRNKHQHISGLLMIKIEVYIHSIKESDTQTDVVSPSLLPA